jgi:hypothetical protein
MKDPLVFLASYPNFLVYSIKTQDRLVLVASNVLETFKYVCKWIHSSFLSHAFHYGLTGSRNARGLDADGCTKIRIWWAVGESTTLGYAPHKTLACQEDGI